MRRRARPDAGAVSQGPPPPALARQGASGPALRWPRGPLSRGCRLRAARAEERSATALRNAVRAFRPIRSGPRRRDQSVARGARLGSADRWCLLDLLRALHRTRGARPAPRAPPRGITRTECEWRRNLGPRPEAIGRALLRNCFKLKISRSDAGRARA